MNQPPVFEEDEPGNYLAGTVDEWCANAVKYIDLLQAACDRSAGFLWAHGWREGDDVVNRGKELREVLGIKGSGE